MNALTPAESKPQPADTKRKQWSDEERDLIVRASLKKGTSVNAVARLYGVQPWQIYDWRKKARQARMVKQSEFIENMGGILMVRFDEQTQVARLLAMLPGW
jgi:transposase-like protein